MSEMLTEKVLAVKRLAVRENGVWRWFSDPVYTTLGQAAQQYFAHFFNRQSTVTPADAVLELECQRAIAQHPIEDLHIIQAPSKEAMDLVKLEKLSE